MKKKGFVFFLPFFPYFFFQVVKVQFQEIDKDLNSPTLADCGLFSVNGLLLCKKVGSLMVLKSEEERKRMSKYPYFAVTVQCRVPIEIS